MKRLLLVLVLCVACDRSTPPMEASGSASTTTQPPVIGTLAPQATTAADLPRAPSDAVEARVERVSDGDTIVLSGISSGELDRSTGGRKARLIGVDTPEVFGQTECFGRKASDFTKATLDKARVVVDFDVDRTDRYGRALVYVWLRDGTFFNGLLVSRGYANQLTVPPNVRYADVFLRLARDARREQRGLWQECV